MRSSITKELAAALYEMTGGKTDEEAGKAVQQFAEYLRKKGLVSKTDAILDDYRKIYNEKNGIVEATVTLVERLPEKTRINLREALKKKYGAREVHMLEKVDHRLIGGIKVKVGDEVYDASLQNSLRTLESKLLG